ncbi:uncharacterized protein LOC123504207 [Portunus trituberculatus]|uniref:uncharacterized protein LOC123504207 n=1 Tax=Portunus trituberculatus TaxID=210409 RepID=UPI001E1D20D2|nr:uncharacterized protein LOC123504207 [Portunus trituberculatus]
MARHRNTFKTFAIVTILNFVASLPPIVLAAAEHSDHQNEASNISDTPAHQSHITVEYGFVWTKAAKPTPRFDFSNFTDDIESVQCSDDEPCINSLPGIEYALSYDSDIPSKPYCYVPDSNTSTGHCTCGIGHCVSYSRQHQTGDPFYYCGPCGIVGSQCKDTICTDMVGECRGGYCECIEDGTFYDMSSCYIPFYGQDTLINVIIGTICVLLCIIGLAYSYHRLRSRRLRRGSIYSERGSGPARRESPSDDTPPTYDDVVEKLPSYQDALEMSHGSEEGFTNAGFEGDEALSSAPTASPNSGAVTLSQTKATFHAHTSSSPLCTDAEDVEDQETNEKEKCSNITPQVTEEQKGLGTQPIEQLLHNVLQEQHTTTTTT